MRTKQELIEQLADILENNPNAFIEIDNDVWYIFDKPYTETEDGAEYGEEIAHSVQFKFESDWYSASNLYGFGVADALICLLNRKGFNFTAKAV